MPLPGSSPRVRGKPLGLTDSNANNRIIPARAGQTRILPRLNITPSDHPRACGANETYCPLWMITQGSSPRVRGKHCRSVPARCRIRIIPARAGQTTMRRHCPPSTPDHPRACGANPPTGTQAKTPTGSSPRVRGKRGELPVHRTLLRIIPARAGQTCILGANGVPRPDHPRACGANRPYGHAALENAGSSPRVRGKRCRTCRCTGLHRIIPARAGQTRTSWRGC